MFYSQLIFKKRKIRILTRVFSFTWGFAMEQELHWLMWCCAVRWYYMPGSMGQYRLGTDWVTVGQLPTPP